MASTKGQGLCSTSGLSEHLRSSADTPMGVGRVGGGERIEPKNDCLLQTKLSTFTTVTKYLQ